MRQLAEIRADIVAKEQALAATKAERASLAAQANAAGDAELALQGEVSALWAEMQDAFALVMQANPEADTYQQLGAAMDAAAAAPDVPPP